MKKFLINSGKAIAYLGTYFGVQIIAMIAISTIITVMITIQNANLSIEEMMRLSSAVLMEKLGIITIISNIFFLLIIWFVILIRKKTVKESLSLYNFDKRYFLPITLFGITANFAISIIMEVIPFPESWFSLYEEIIDATLEGGFIETFLLVVIFAPIVEEILCRSLIYGRLKQGMPSIIAAIISSIIFGVLHGNPIQAIYTMLIGLMFVVVFERAKSLWVCIYLHLVFNLTAFILSYVQETELVNMLIGIFSISSLFISVVVGIWFMKISGTNNSEEKEETSIL